MIDDMQGLYSHASDAYRAGQREGRDEFFRHAMAMLSAAVEDMAEMRRKLSVEGAACSHASDAYRAGQREGRDEFFRHAMAMLSGISSKWEKAGSDASFDTAEECCRALRHIKAKLGAPRNAT